MKTVLLLRHGKSNWDASYVGDHERPLSLRGQKAAARMGRFIARVGPVPNMVLCSTAVRTRQTLEIAMEAGEWGGVDVAYDQTLYLATYDQMLGCITALSDRIDTVLLVGHEPTTSLFMGQLIGSASIRFPTTAVARIDLNMEHWSSCRTGVGSLEWFVTPRIVKALRKSSR